MLVNYAVLNSTHESRQPAKIPKTLRRTNQIIEMSHYLSTLIGITETLSPVYLKYLGKQTNTPKKSLAVSELAAASFCVQGANDI